MNKKLICLFLTLIMLVSVCLVSCGEEDVDVPVTPLTTRTLSMFVVTDKTVYEIKVLDYVEKYLTTPDQCDDAHKAAAQKWIKDNVPSGTTPADFIAEQRPVAEQYGAVEEQINVITKKQYSIQLNIEYIREDVYYEHVKECLKTSNTGYTGVIEDSVTVENEIGVPEYLYPEIPATQVDILYIGDKVYFNEFVEDGLLSSLTNEINGTYKTLKTEIYPSYLNSLTIGGDLYGIPNNVPTGEYTYLLLNKELADKYSFSASDIDTWEECEKFLEVVADEVDAPILLPEGISESAYTPEDIFNNFLINTHYWSVSYEKVQGENVYKLDPAKFSLLGTSYIKEATQNGTSTTKYLFDNTLASSTQQSQLASLLHYMEKDYFKNASEGETYAISLFTGDIKEAQKYQNDYYMVLVNTPHIDEDGAYKGMFAVGAMTTNLSKSAQIISFIQTNPEIRNLLQYGIQGSNYVLDENECVISLEGNRYNMDINVTGNILKAYAPDTSYATYDEEGNIKDIWGLAKLQASHTLINPLFRFDINKAINNCEYKIDLKALEQVNALSEEYFDKLLEIDRTLSISEISELIKAMGRELNSNATLNKMKSNNYSTNNSDDATANGTSVAEAYYQWLFDNNLATVSSAAPQ